MHTKNVRTSSKRIYLVGTIYHLKNKSNKCTELRKQDIKHIENTQWNK